MQHCSMPKYPCLMRIQLKHMGDFVIFALNFELRVAGLPECSVGNGDSLLPSHVALARDTGVNTRNPNKNAKIMCPLVFSCQIRIP